MPTFDLTKVLAWLANPKSWIYIAGVFVLLLFGFKTYNWVFERGYAKRDKELQAQITQLTKDRDTAVANYATYKGEYDNWVRTTKNAQEQYLKEQLQDLADRQARLAKAEADFAKKPTTIKEVIKYVTPEVDATYPVPMGALQLYARTLQGEPTGDTGTDLSFSIGKDAGTAASLTMSQFGQIYASNNAQHSVCRVKLAEWQDWYITNKTSFDKLQRYQITAAPQPTK